MSVPLLIIVAILYGLVAIDSFLRSDEGLALFAAGCAVANLGLALKALP